METCELLPVRRKVRNDNSDETNCKYKEVIFLLNNTFLN